ncbi:hypothetical protein VNO77_42416 [Canavalia gladiata]|uniref:Uncharacterized protein n=1 Tax=Canavalia gladiata TaxID=3824 RepID=A0AAN9PLZ8_CANGL
MEAMLSQSVTVRPIISITALTALSVVTATIALFTTLTFNLITSSRIFLKTPLLSKRIPILTLFITINYPSLLMFRFFLKGSCDNNVKVKSVWGNANAIRMASVDRIWKCLISQELEHIELDGEEEDDEPVFVLTDEWREFFAKSEARRKLAALAVSKEEAGQEGKEVNREKRLLQITVWVTKRVDDDPALEDVFSFVPDED